MFTIRPRKLSARPAARAPARRNVIRRSEPTDAQIKDAIKEAEESCEGDNKGECAAAWDTVEELSAAASHKKSGVDDPLEKYCESAPDADECRVYED